MKTTHLIPVYVEVERETTIGLAAPSLGSFSAVGDELVEIELTAKVSLVSGTRDELEVEWVGDSEKRFDDLTDAEQEGAVERAETGWWDAMENEPSDEEVRADYELQRWKEERHP
jgi:hypothetical protein